MIGSPELVTNLFSISFSSWIDLGSARTIVVFRYGCKTKGNVVFLQSSLTDDIERKSSFYFGHFPKKRGGVLLCLNLLDLFQEVHIWSIKGVYFF